MKKVWNKEWKKESNITINYYKKERKKNVSIVTNTLTLPKHNHPHHLHQSLNLMWLWGHYVSEHMTNSLLISVVKTGELFIYVYHAFGK